MPWEARVWSLPRALASNSATLNPALLARLASQSPATPPPIMARSRWTLSGAWVMDSVIPVTATVLIQNGAQYKSFALELPLQEQRVLLLICRKFYGYTDRNVIQVIVNRCNFPAGAGAGARAGARAI